jgi:hypothetical protein
MSTVDSQWKYISFGGFLILLITVGYCVSLSTQVSNLQELNEKKTHEIEQEKYLNVAFKHKSKKQDVAIALHRENDCTIIPLAGQRYSFTIYYSQKRQKGYLIGRNVPATNMSIQYQLWKCSATDSLSVGLFTSDEFETGSELFEMEYTNQRLLFTQETMGGAKSIDPSHVIAFTH